MWQAYKRLRGNSRLFALTVSLFILALLFLYSIFREDAQTISVQSFQAISKQKMIDSLLLANNTLYIRTTDKKRYKIYYPLVQNTPQLQKHPLNVKPSKSYLLWAVVLFVLLVFIVQKFNTPTRWGQMRSLSNKISSENSTETGRIVPTKTDVTFDDVAGIEQVKDELEEIIDFLNAPQKYRKLGIRLPKGVLLEGPPGVGKTHIAKAVANEAGVSFFYHSGASFAKLYVGAGPKRVRDLFATAKAHAPSIVFIDEIDAVGKRRGGEGNEEREATLNQLLTEIDGFESDSGVIVIAATNKIEVLDEALMRPGRFDRRITLSLPDAKDRERILKLYLQHKPHRIDYQKWAKKTIGFSAAALETFVNEAALHALRHKRDLIDDSDFEAVRNQILLGKQQHFVLSPQEQKVQAFYQASKAITAVWFGLTYDRVGINTMHVEYNEERVISRSKLLARLSVYLAGKVALKIEFNETYSNVSEDLKLAKRLALTMTEEYAMSPSSDTLLEETQSQLRELIQKMLPAIKQASKHLLQEEYITYATAQRIIKEHFS